MRHSVSSPSARLDDELISEAWHDEHGCCEGCDASVCAGGEWCLCGLEKVVEHVGLTFCSDDCLAGWLLATEPELAALLVASAEAGAAAGSLLWGFGS